jgi:hypothetical protein
MVYPGQPDWNEDQLSLGKPQAMDTPTLIEWIQRQLETPVQTLARFLQMQEEHREWHQSGGGAGMILACCIRTGPPRSEYERIVAKYDKPEWRASIDGVWLMEDDAPVAEVYLTDE